MISADIVQKPSGPSTNPSISFRSACSTTSSQRSSSARLWAASTYGRRRKPGDLLYLRVAWFLALDSPRSVDFPCSPRKEILQLCDPTSRIGRTQEEGTEYARRSRKVSKRKPAWGKLAGDCSGGARGTDLVDDLRGELFAGGAGGFVDAALRNRHLAAADAVFRVHALQRQALLHRCEAPEVDAGEFGCVRSVLQENLAVVHKGLNRRVHVFA